LLPAKLQHEWYRLYMERMADREEMAAEMVWAYGGDEPLR
jgi:hypothetical protein